MEIIRLENIVKKYDNHTIINHLNLSIKENEMVAIMGESGSGKSTLLNIIGLIETIDEGKYFLYDKENIKVNSKEAIMMIRNHINYLFQNFALLDDDTIENNLLIGLEYTNYSKKEKTELIQEVLKKVKLDHSLKTKVSSLSGGEQQRLAIARIILKQGDIILADEPTGALDEKNKKVVLKLLKELHQEGKTIIIVTHDIEVGNSCDRIVQLK